MSSLLKYRARERRGLAAGEWIAMVAVFIVGTGLGLWATGGLEMPQARAALIDLAQRSGVNVEPYIGQINNPVGAQLRQVVASTSDPQAEIDAEDAAAESQPPLDAAALRQLVADAGETAQQDAAPAPTKKKKAKQPRSAKANEGAATLQYWNQLNSIMTQEEGLRNTPGKVTAENANGFVNSLAAANTFAAQEIRGLSTKNVDPQVVALGGEIAAWYEAGAANNGEATYLLNEADADTRRGGRGKSYEKSEHEHRKQCEEINRKGDALRDKMSKKYGLDFPDLK
ncbi:MAG: hypothetical protein KF708_21450 [Pirellulales bacterium]|nr:hypothetical protein [Pirellulales bacterium]